MLCGKPVDVAVKHIDPASLRLAERRRHSISVSNTLCRLNAERLMTLSTSAVAICCCSNSLSSEVRACTSSKSRAFSIAITA